MKKRGQITIFIILALFIIIALAIFLSSQNKFQNEEIIDESGKIISFSDIDERTVEYGEHCVEFTTEQAFDSVWVIDAYMLKDYIHENLNKCMNDFEPLRQEGFNYEYDDFETTLELTEEYLYVDVEFPITITQDEQETEVEHFIYKKLRQSLSLDELGGGSFDQEITDDTVLNVDIPEGFEMTSQNIIFKEEIRYGSSVYIVKVHMNDPSIRFLVTPHQDGVQWTSEFLLQHDLDVAANGAGWPIGDPNYKSNDQSAYFLASEGDIYNSNGTAWTTFFFSEEQELYRGKGKPKDVWNAITGFQTLVVDGVVAEKIADPSHPNHKPLDYGAVHARTSYGDNENENIFLYIIVDGPGTDAKTLGQIQIEEGATRAVNMDGGGSTTLVVKGMGVVNLVGESGQRAVATHLGVWGKAWTLEIK